LLSSLLHISSIIFNILFGKQITLKNKGTGTLFQTFQILVDDTPVMRAIWRIFVPTTSFITFNIASCFSLGSLQIFTASIPNSCRTICRRSSSLTLTLILGISRQISSFASLKIFTNRTTASSGLPQLLPLNLFYHLSFPEKTSLSPCFFL